IRQLRSRADRPRGQQAPALGVPGHRVSGGGTGRHRFGPQSHRNILTLEKPLRKISAALVAVFAVVTLLTQPRGAERDGAPLLTGAQVPANVMAKIAGSCADCHSETTRYPWYSYVAPVSLLIKSDVERGRAHLNLSRWADYSLVRRQRSLSEIANQVKDREM